MAEQEFRNHHGGRIDRARAVNFHFDGDSYCGYGGDTLASALLANGVRMLGRSFKYHRPRGIYGAGVEEPNALVRLRRNGRAEPNVRATQVELFDGLSAVSQNYWPSLRFDIGVLNNVFSRLLPAGFYYKTFMWPPSWWMFYEKFIRRAAGLGESAIEPDPDRYERRYAHCDVLVVGGGPTGLMAALSAASSGLRVMLVDEQAALGGRLLCEHHVIDDAPADVWAEKVGDELSSMGNVRILTRATAFAYYDQNMVNVLERVSDHLLEPEAFQPRQRLWQVRAGRVVIATGAIERPLVFANNDVPGVMLASAVQTYANQYAVRCGKRAVVFTNNDSAYQAALDMHAAGVQVSAIVDSRGNGAKASLTDRVSQVGTEVLTGHVISNVRGSRSVHGVEVLRYNAERQSVYGSERLIHCDLVASSGGWNPTVHLFSQSQGKLRYDEALSAFVPAQSQQQEITVGAAAGSFRLQEDLTEGRLAGEQSVEALGAKVRALPTPKANSLDSELRLEALWQVPLPAGRHAKRFVDLQNDVGADDVKLAAREGYRSVEHVKRYTTLGMGTDQGRTSNVNGLAILAASLAEMIPNVGTTTFRPPFSPVSLGAIGGREIGEHFSPIRMTPMHEWHIEHGAPWVPAGQWLRPQYYARTGESLWDAIYRETRTVREGVAMIDVSTLGKIEIQGRDAAEFLERVYINRWKSLKIGKSRYGLMLREDGFLYDDGTTTRISEHHYYMTVTTANAGPVMSHLEFYAQTVWPELHVHLTSVTDQWGGLALAGPKSRDVLATVLDDSDVSDESLPFMGYMEATIGGAPVRVFRITFSGELAYEIHMPADYGMGVFDAVFDAGKSWNIVPYGTEALSILRIEKGHIVGAEMDGRTLAADFGFERMQRTDTDFIGKRSLKRPGLQEKRKTIVGLMSVDTAKPIPRGAQLVVDPNHPPPSPMLGHVTSRCYSPNLKAQIALGLIENAEAYKDRVIYAMAPLTNESVQVRVTHSVFIDPKGERCRG